MSNISKPYTLTDGTTAYGSEVEANFTTIYNDYNGGISATNLASNAVTTAKIADSNVTTAKIADDSVTDAKLDYPRWWQEIARTTLSTSSDTITVGSIPARKYLKVIVYTIASGGTNSLALNFNGDTTNNYSLRESANGGADTTTTSYGSIRLDAGAAASPMFSSVEIVNIASAEKLVIGHTTVNGNAGAASTPFRKEFNSKWSNTSAQITSMTLTNAGTGDFGAGSEVVVLGHD